MISTIQSVSRLVGPMTVQHGEEFTVAMHDFMGGGYASLGIPVSRSGESQSSVPVSSDDRRV